MTWRVDQHNVPLLASRVENVDQPAAHPRIAELSTGMTHGDPVRGEYVEVGVHVADQCLLHLGATEQYGADIGDVMPARYVSRSSLAEENRLTGLLIEIDDQNSRAARRQGIGQVERE